MSFYSPQHHAKKVEDVKTSALHKAGLSLLRKTAEGSRIMDALLPGGFDALVQIKEHSKRFGLAIRNGVDPVAIPDTPKTYEKQESGGIIGLMNDFVTDLKTDMAEAETSEKHAAADYVRIMTDAKNSRAQLVKSSNQKKSSKATVEDKLVSNKALL